RGYGDVVIGALLSMVIVVVVALCVIGPARIAKSAKGFFWTKTACVIAEFAEKSRHDDDLSAVIIYTYEFNGENYRGKYAFFADSERDLDFERDKYVSGAKKVCYVDPEVPSRSMLEREYSDFEIFVYLGGASLFIAVCVGGVLAFLVYCRSHKGSLKGRLRVFYLKKIAFLTLAVFVFMIGMVAFYYAGIVNFILAYDSRSWKPVSAEIVESELVVDRSRPWIDYKLNLKYRYNFAGKGRESSGFSLFEFDHDLSSKEGINDIVAEYPVGRKLTCYANPANPGEAVLDRELSWNLLGGLIPSLLSVFGIWFFISVWRDSSSGIHDDDLLDESWDELDDFEDGGMEFQRAGARPGKFVFNRSTSPGEPLWAYSLIVLMCGLAALVRGLYIWIPGHWGFLGDPIVFCFGVLFIMGAGLAVWTVLKERSRDYRVRLHVGSFESGGKCRLVWELLRSWGGIRDFSVIVEMVEVAGGEGDSEAESILFSETLLEQPALVGESSDATFVVPELPAESSLQIQWRIKVLGRCLFPLPPIKECYLIEL
ncbi:MAG: DUF3592 domain-containing protein, partial [Victivallales bacterium]|nr:DUF3592 domain-containing protein [Victivallales bacterium]